MLAKTGIAGGQVEARAERIRSAGQLGMRQRIFVEKGAHFLDGRSQFRLRHVLTDKDDVAGRKAEEVSVMRAHQHVEHARGGQQIGRAPVLATQPRQVKMQRAAPAVAPLQARGVVEQGLLFTQGRCADYLCEHHGLAPPRNTGERPSAPD